MALLRYLKPIHGLLDPIYHGKCGSHAHKGLSCTLRPCSKSCGAKNVTVSKFSWCQIFAGSLNQENLAPQKFNT